MEEAEEVGVEVPRPFFPTALAAYVLTLHDTQTWVVECRRATASKDIGGGNTDGGYCHVFVTSFLLFNHPSSQFFSQQRLNNSSAR